MTSPQVEIQLKPHHRPYAVIILVQSLLKLILINYVLQVRVAWSSLLDKYYHGCVLDKTNDEPMITLRRSVFYPRKDEEKIKY